MCARHDITIGRYLIELEPIEASQDGLFLLYLHFVDQVDGSSCWKGCVRVKTGAFWEVDTYGGSPLFAECHTDEVPSE